MHRHLSEAEFLEDIAGVLGGFYAALALMNAAAALYLSRSGRSRTCVRLPFVGVRLTTAHLCLLVSLALAALAPLAFTGDPQRMQLLSLPQCVRDALDRLMDPKWCTAGLYLGLLLLFFFRKFFVRPAVAWTGLNAVFLFMALSLTDPDFAAVAGKPDNVAIVGMIFLLGFFTWVATRRAVANDERLGRGEDPLEKRDSDKVLVWPDLVYIELICMVAVTALLLAWSIAIKAPLEAPASAAITPNPSKAPWYFVGLQEMLVYFDPWMAGVVMPTLILFGLMAVPYLDFNEKGNGYYTIDQRKFAYLTYQFGFLGLWIALILVGTFIRGPNWNFFGLYETWDVHKVEPLNNVDLSEYFWIGLLGRSRPKAPVGASELLRLGYLACRELPGIVLLLTYYLLTPLLLARGSRWFREAFARMGWMPYVLLSWLLLTMMLLPIKMVCRWAFNLKYFVAIPEYLANF